MQLPWWSEVLVLSEKWGTPPWEIVNDKNQKNVWILRERIWSRESAAALKTKTKH